MGKAVLDSNGVYAGRYSQHEANLTLAAGETLFDTTWDEANNRPVGVTMPPDTTPNWQGFADGVDDLSFYASKILLGTASNLFAALIHNVEVRNSTRVGQLLTLMITAYSMTTAEVEEMQDLLDDNNIPITLPV